MEKKLDAYLGTTHAQLTHYFGNNVGAARILQVYPDPEASPLNFEERKEGFIQGLEKTIEENPPEFGGVTIAHLQEMVDIAQGEWSDVKTIKALYRRYHQITDEEFDEDKLFPEQQ